MKIHANNPIIAYKGFSKNLISWGHHYKVDVLYQMEPDLLDPSFAGYHSCRYPHQVLQYFKNSVDNVFYKVAISGEVIEDSDKLVSSEIKILEKIDIISEIIKYANTYEQDNTTIYSNLDNDILQSNGYKSHINLKNTQSIGVTTNDETHICSLGYQNSIKTIGKLSHAVALNDHSTSETNGERSRGGCMGDWSDSITYGNFSHSIVLGDASNTLTYGDHSHAIAVGNVCKAITHNKNSLSVALGPRCKVKSNYGIILTDWQFENIWKLKGIYTALIGEKILGIIIKKDTWYWIENGKLKYN